MSVVGVVMRSDATLVVADRAVVRDGIELAPGVPWPEPPAPKLFLGSGGVTVAIAGKASALPLEGEVVDLRPIVAVAAERPSALEVATTLAAQFDILAPLFREHAGAGAVPAQPFTRPVLTVAVVADTSSAGRRTMAVGLTWDGVSEVHTLAATTIYAPEQVYVDLAHVAAEAEVAPDIDAAVDLMVAAVRRAAGARGGLGFISLDADVVVLPVGGRPYALECRYEPAAPPPGV